MEKRISHLFYELSILIYFVSFTKILILASESTPKNIVQNMISDLELCNLPQVVYENDIIKNCSTLKYPDNNITLTTDNRNTFLCLVFYDTLYKICNSNTSNQIPSDNIKFKSYIQKFFPEKDHVNMFCENIKNIAFSHKKLEPLLSPIHFNKPSVCYLMCSNLKDEFNPLCAVLAWSKSIDENIKSSNKSEKTQSQDLTKNMGVQQFKTANSDLNKTTETTILKNTNGQQTKQSAVKPSLPNSVQELPPVNVNDKSSTKSESIDIKKHVSESPHKTPENINTANINSIEKNIKDVNDIKTSTISENTQDHENSVNQEDWSHIDNEKSPYDPDDGADHSLDTADQNQNEPSEQRDIISRYHSRRSDEESHFFTYFTLVFLVSIAAYIGYHNKQKILAIVLEGRRSRNNRGRRRPSTANYRKLDYTLEEAVTSQCNANVTHVIY